MHALKIMGELKMKKLVTLLIFFIAIPVIPANVTIPADLVSKVTGQAPKISPTDDIARETALDITKRINALDASDPMVQKYLARLEEKLIYAYRVYNDDNISNPEMRRYHVATNLKQYLEFYVRILEIGEDPAQYLAGSFMGGVVEESGELYSYRYIVPGAYTPSKAWPVWVGHQKVPPNHQMVVDYDYIAVYSGGGKASLQDLAKDLHINPFRTYVTSHSDGALGSVIEIAQHSHNWAAYSPVASGVREPHRYPIYPYIKYIQNVPTQYLVGYYDDMGFLTNVKNMYQEMMDLGYIVEFRTWKGGHSDTPNKDAEAYEWLIDFFDRYTLNPYPTTVTHIVDDIYTTRAYWTNALLNKSYTSSSLLHDFEVWYKVTANRAENTIVIEHAEDRISGMQFMLNDSLVDLSKPVKIVRNGDTLFNKMITAGGKVTVFLYTKDNIPSTLPEIHRAAGYFSNMEDTLLWEHLQLIEKSCFGTTTAIPKQSGTADVNRSINPNQHTLAGISIFPNPFKASTVINVSIGNSSISDFGINIYDIKGRLVKNLVYSKDIKAVAWDGRDNHGHSMASGIYLVRAKFGDQVITRRALLKK
jgi:hypothetical protein